MNLQLRDERFPSDSCGWDTNVSDLDLSIRVGDVNINETWTLKMFGKKESKRLEILGHPRSTHPTTILLN